jgi:hypothetical protein
MKPMARGMDEWMNRLAEAKYPIGKKDCRLTRREKEGKREAYKQRLGKMLETMTEAEIIKQETN